MHVLALLDAMLKDQNSGINLRRLYYMELRIKYCTRWLYFNGVFLLRPLIGHQRWDGMTKSGMSKVACQWIIIHHRGRMLLILVHGKVLICVNSLNWMDCVAMCLPWYVYTDWNALGNEIEYPYIECNTHVLLNVYRVQFYCPWSCYVFHWELSVCNLFGSIERTLGTT